ncbi:MAG: DUF3450 domain-containing protein [Gammaproteobacteria bacterium]
MNSSMFKLWSYPQYFLGMLVFVGLSIGTAQSLEAFEADAYPEETLDPVIQAGGDLRNVAVKSQEQIDNLASTRTTLLGEYRNLQKEIDIQLLYNNQIKAQIDVQEAKKQELQLSIRKVDELQRQVSPLSYKMLESLARAVELDLPFHLYERRQRVERVRQSMTSADIKPSEQLRQILELYDIELQYSSTIDTYDEFIKVEGVEREVNVLRWGRMALIYLSLDESAVGIYDADTQSWRSLPIRYRNAVRQGLRMARKQASIDMLLLPVKAPELAK